MSTSKGLSTVWESTVLVSSLSHFLTRVKTESRLLRDSIRSHPISYDLSTWSLSPCLSVKTADAFISTLQRLSPGTSELVSISMPCQTLRPLSVCITGGQTADAAKPSDVKHLEEVLLTTGPRQPASAGRGNGEGGAPGGEDPLRVLPDCVRLPRSGQIKIFGPVYQRQPISVKPCDDCPL